MLEIQRALISCWDKTGLDELCRRLKDFNIEIVSSGGTCHFLQTHGIDVIPVEVLTGFPEVLGGRVKTLHPAIHAGLLAEQSPSHQEELQKIGVKPFQLVVVNLYPFTEMAVHSNLPLEEAIEYIDIGGPTILRAAAKNFKNVVILHQPNLYKDFLKVLEENTGRIPLEYRVQRAREIFFYTSWYDAQIQAYFDSCVNVNNHLPALQCLHLSKAVDLRYGENPHQQAALYHFFNQPLHGLVKMQQVWGKQLSFNNYMDIQAAYALVLEFKEPAAVIVKHSNPCGAAISPGNLADAFSRALQGDPLSAFGGIVALNRPVNADCAERMSKIFFECSIAPNFEEPALSILTRKKNLRLLKLAPEEFVLPKFEVKPISGGYLLQEPDIVSEPPGRWKVVTERAIPSDAQRDLEFAWKIVKHVKSNAIVIVKGLELYGVGAGQMSRVDSVRIACQKALQAGRSLEGAVLASDAFFPFRDGVDQAAEAGIRTIIQPGGSVRDSEVIQAANEHRLSMIFTGTRHFKH